MYKRWRRWTALLLALTLAVGLLPATAEAEGSDEVIIGNSTYNVCLGMESSRRGEVVYRPTSMERGIISEDEETQWDYYILLYDDDQDTEALPEIYQAFWNTYEVEVSTDDSTSASVELTALQDASDGYHKYVSVTVTGPWDGRIDGSFTPKDTSSGTDGSFSSDVSIQLAQKLEPDSDASGDYSFSLKNVKPREDRYFYIDLGEAQPVTVSGTLSTKGQINLVQVDSEDNTKTLWIWDDEIHDSSSAEVFGQILLFEVHVREEAGLSGTISVEVEQPALLYRNMRYDDTTNTWYEDAKNSLWPLADLQLELGYSSSVRLYYGTTASSEPVTELTVDGDTLTVEPMKDRDGKTYWELRGVEYGESTLNWTADSEGGSVDVFVDLPEYAFYSVQRRDVNYYLDEISYSDLPADKTVWLMSKDGFTNEEVEDISVFADNEPINTSAVPRPDNSDRYDIQFVVPEPDAGQGLYVEAMLSGGYIAGCPVSLVQSGSALYLEDYAAGFAWEMGDILMINEGDWQLGWSIPAGDGSYVPFPDGISITVGEKKTDANGGKYFEVVDNASVFVDIKELRIEPISGPENAFSFSAGSAVTSLDTPTFPVTLYCLDNVDCSAVVKAEVELRADNDVTSGTVSIFVFKKVITRTEIERPDNDTIEALNADLKNLKSSGIYTIHLGPRYEGTIELPKGFKGDLTLTGRDNHTVIHGGINLNGGELSVLQDVSFFAQNDTESALYGGKCTNIYNCFFSGYTVAADATAGMLTFSGGNVFAGNEIAVQMDAAEHSGGANLNAWEKNSFVRNTTAVQVLSFNDLVSPYYFRIVDSKFIGNDTDFDLQAEGTVYLYRNYFGRVHPQAGNMSLSEYLTNLINADGKQSLQRLVTSNSPNIGKGGSARGKVVTNPRWKYPVEDWWQLITPIDELFGAGNALAVQADEESYDNYLTSDWNLLTQIVNEEAGELLLDDAAFNEAEGEKQINVVDQNETPLGTWTFD